MDINKNQQAQDINSIEEINNNPEPVIEITLTPTPIITEEEIKEEIKPIEQINRIPMIKEPKPIEIDDDGNPIEEPRPDGNKPKNTVRYIDSGFTF